jgi:tetratricopeptide (TPR) repeat protein
MDIDLVVIIHLIANVFYLILAVLLFNYSNKENRTKNLIYFIIAFSVSNYLVNTAIGGYNQRLRIDGNRTAAEAQATPSILLGWMVLLIAYIIIIIYVYDRRKWLNETKKCEMILESMPEDTNTRLRLANAYFKLGEYEKSILNYEELLELKPNEKTTTIGLAKALKFSGDLVRSEKIMRTLLTEHPNDVEVINGLAQILSHKGLYREADELFKKAE